MSPSSPTSVPISAAVAVPAAPVFLPYIVPLLVVASHQSSSVWHTLIPPAFVWVVVPTIDVFAGAGRGQLVPNAPSSRHLTPAERRALEARPIFALAVLLWVPVQLVILVWASARFSADTALPDRIQATTRAFSLLLSMSLVSAEGINCAHELLHRSSRVERLMGELLLVSVCYGHFFIEHTRGHHKTVATDQDPATLAEGESFYHFLPRTIFGGFRSAWHLEKARLARAGHDSPWNIHNMMLVYCITPVIFFALPLATVFNWRAVVFFFGQAFIAIVLLEQINAIEHYGLRRDRLPNGEYEPIGAEHSWDASHPLSNHLLFKLQRHADHHLHAGKRYHTLELTSESPQLPYGYLTLAPCLFIPPLWRAIMDPVLHEYQEGRGRRKRE
jgi:alkane 1-monooxygenase